MALAPNNEQLELEYENLSIKNRFIFSKVMTDKDLCARVLRCLTGNVIEDIGDITAEKYLQITDDSKGVRYDIYVEDNDNKIYDTEMQNYTYKDMKDILLRCRYYQSIIDNNMMDSGMHYDQLKDSYVIFICTFDPFGFDERRYSFGIQCLENKELSVNDGRSIMIFNTCGHLGNLSGEAKEFLDYVEYGTISGSLSEALDNAVRCARRNKKWRAEYMRNMANYWDAIRTGQDMGIEEGRALGRSIGLEEGKELGRSIGLEEGNANSLVNCVTNFMNNTKCSLEDALKLLGTTMDEYLKAKEIVDNKSV